VSDRAPVAPAAYAHRERDVPWLAASVAGELAARDLLPALGQARRAHDVARDERDQHAIVDGSARGSAASGEERLDGVEDLIGVDADEVVCAPAARRSGRRGCARRCSGPPRRAEAGKPATSWG
jgi:hypothetical protein